MQKDGIKTSEFWVNICVTLFNGLIAAGIIPHANEVNAIVASIGSFLVAIGYTWARAFAKKY